MKQSILSLLAILSMCFLCACVADVEAPKPSVLDFGNTHLIFKDDSLSIGDTLSAEVVLDSSIRQPLRFEWSVFDSIIITDDPSLSIVVARPGASRLVVHVRDEADKIVWSDTQTFFVRSLPTLSITALEPAVIFSPVTLIATILDERGPVTYSWKYSGRDTTTEDPKLKAFFTEVKTISVTCEARLRSNSKLLDADTLQLVVRVPALQISESQLHGYTKVELRCFSKFTIFNQFGGDIENSIIDLIGVERKVHRWTDSGSYYKRVYDYSDSAEWRKETESFVTSVDVEASMLRNVTFLKDFKYNWGKGYSEGSDYMKLNANNLYLISATTDSAVFARGGSFAFDAELSYYDRPEPSGYSVEGKWIDEMNWYDPNYPPFCYVIFRK